jgi:putative ATPase
VAAKDAYHFLGSPEGELALAEAAVYLATAPKSNKIYEAWGRALDAARETPSEPVPLHIRNAPTPLMADLGYGRGYKYAHHYPGAFVAQPHLPERLRSAQFYQPGGSGYEGRVRERLLAWRRRAEEEGGGGGGRAGGPGGAPPGMEPGEGTAPTDT